MSTLAICIPAWNAVSHLPRLMDSIREQTQPFDEVLVHDDASTDETAELARSYGATVVHSEDNVGCSLGKNRLAQSTGCDWVHFHDADEALRPEFVERARRWMSADAADVVIFATEDRDDVTGEVLGSWQWDDTQVSRDAVRYNIVRNVTNCGIYRRTRFLEAGGFDVAPETRYNEDKAMHLRLALAGLSFRAEPYVGVIVYRRANSMSSGNPVACGRAQFHVLEQTALRVGDRYASDVGRMAWHLAGVCGTYKDWAYAKRCVDLANGLGHRNPREEGRLFRLLAMMHPMGAVVLREQLIRWFKPALRRGVPVAV